MSHVQNQCLRGNLYLPISFDLTWNYKSLLPHNIVLCRTVCVFMTEVRCSLQESVMTDNAVDRGQRTRQRTPQILTHVIHNSHVFVG